MCTYLYKITTIASQKMDATSLGGNVVNLDDTISSPCPCLSLLYIAVVASQVQASIGMPAPSNGAEGSKAQGTARRRRARTLALDLRAVGWQGARPGSGHHGSGRAALACSCSSSSARDRRTSPATAEGRSHRCGRPGGANRGGLPSRTDAVHTHQSGRPYLTPSHGRSPPRERGHRRRGDVPVDLQSVRLAVGKSAGPAGPGTQQERRCHAELVGRSDAHYPCRRCSGSSSFSTGHQRCHRHGRQRRRRGCTLSVNGRRSHCVDNFGETVHAPSTIPLERVFQLAIDIEQTVAVPQSDDSVLSRSGWPRVHVADKG